MKKFFSFAFVAMMSLAMISFVACNKQNDPEPPMETPEVLTGTTWIHGEGTSFEATLIFQTESAGIRKVHNVINDQAYDTETDITYTYQNGAGQYTDDIDHSYEFTVDGNKLTVKEIGYDEVYTFKK